jgi:hypothetical protein
VIVRRQPNRSQLTAIAMFLNTLSCSPEPALCARCRQDASMQHVTYLVAFV